MSTQWIDPSEIKAAVREQYGKVALGSACCGEDPAASCCGTTAATCCGDTRQEATNSACCSDEASAPPYSADELGSIPVAAAQTSRGCGNPLAIAALKPGEVVLDLGSGGGIDLLLAAPRVGETGYVYGVDMTDAMIELARRNLREAGVTNGEVLKGDIEALPLPDASVDVIISNCVINLSPDKDQALREAFRVLRPGGRLAVSDVVIDGDLEGLPVSEMQIRSALSWAGCIAGALTATEYRRLLAEAGFEDIGVETKFRYGSAGMLIDAPPALAELPPPVVEELVGRFTSSAISARRPDTSA